MKKSLVLLLFLTPSLYAQNWNSIGMMKTNGYFTTATSGLPDKDQVEEEWANYKYGSINLTDGDIKTAWVEGEPDDGVGQSVYISIPNNCRTINIFNGYTKSKTLFAQNNRVKRLKLRCYLAINPEGYVTEIADAFLLAPYPQDFYLDLKDMDSLQTFAFPIFPEEIDIFKSQAKKEYLENYTEPIIQMAVIIQLEIKSVYKGTKYNDTCISEVFFSDIFITDSRQYKYDKVQNVYLDENYESRVLIDTQDQKGIVILEDPESVFQIIDVSGNNQWATIIRMPVDIGYGRAETEYLILNTKLGRVMNREIENVLGILMLDPLFITDKNGYTILEHSQGEIVLQ
ncbi:MAG: hypothetical protein PHD06_04290 [Bacteroidales bacterium]|nr:hypothetical protein [Bacteroidales bacterium]MDD4384379.1 hypothetical protein [Bacteroidales bacterium]MDY0197748.1 hypothetical protein [Tenuifilaceae bacterium]